MAIGLAPIIRECGSGPVPAALAGTALFPPPSQYKSGVSCIRSRTNGGWGEDVQPLRATANRLFTPVIPKQPAVSFFFFQTFVPSLSGQKFGVVSYETFRQCKKGGDFLACDAPPQGSPNILVSAWVKMQDCFPTHFLRTRAMVVFCVVQT
jgi:hypothetical protein